VDPVFKEHFHDGEVVEIGLVWLFPLPCVYTKTSLAFALCHAFSIHPNVGCLHSFDSVASYEEFCFALRLADGQDLDWIVNC
jgi:hypothetical protein